MDLYEFQGKRFFADYGVKIPKGVVITSADELPEMPEGAVVKTQVLTGGRGKAGGVAICANSSEIQAAVEKLLGAKIKGHAAKRLLIEEKADIALEFYLSIFINRKAKTPSIMFSDQGGVNIESVPKDRISIVNVNPLIGLRGYMIKRLLTPFAIERKEEITKVIQRIYQLFTDKKLQLVEINPLVLTKSGEVMALDAKVTMDDWVIDPSVDIEQQEGGGMTEFEREMLKHEVVAVEMEGDIAVYANGAGVSMATADCVKHRGARIRAVVDEGSLPAARDDQALRTESAGVMRLLLDLKPKVILMNMHFQAGMLDLEALTIKEAFGEVCKEIPIVVRFKGRNAAEACEILKDSGMYVTQSFKEACDIAVSKL